MTARSRVAPRRGPPSLGHAEFAPRLLAWFLDVAGISVLLEVVSSQFIYPVLYELLFSTLGSQTDSGIIYVWTILGIGILELGLIVAFEIVFLQTLRATPGQRLVGLMTVTSESGISLPLSRAVGRAFMLFGPFVAIMVIPPNLGTQLDTTAEVGFAWVKVLPWVVRIVALLWYFALAASVRAPDGRGFHDLASRSVVVRRMP